MAGALFICAGGTLAVRQMVVAEPVTQEVPAAPPQTEPGTTYTNVFVHYHNGDTFVYHGRRAAKPEGK